jgi:hypothetical protein
MALIPEGTSAEQAMTIYETKAQRRSFFHEPIFTVRTPLSHAEHWRYRRAHD